MTLMMKDDWTEFFINELRAGVCTLERGYGVEKFTLHPSFLPQPDGTLEKYSQGFLAYNIKRKRFDRIKFTEIQKFNGEDINYGNPKREATTKRQTEGGIKEAESKTKAEQQEVSSS